MKARASGTPAKFEATPENVRSSGAERAGQPAADDGVREQETEEPAQDRGHEADLDARRGTRC